MRLIRQGTFETNSSSTHALVIPHEVDEERYNIYDSLDHEYCYGREECRMIDDWDEKLAYVYYVLYNFKDRYDIREKDKGYGSNIKVTDKELSDFKSKVNLAYAEVCEINNNHPYDGDPEPNDIFYIVENCDKLKEIKYNPYRDDPKDVDGINEEERRLCYVLPRYVGREEYSDIYVDHTEDFGENGFINKILDADVEYIKKLIFNKESYITIGGDEYRGYNIKTIGFEYDYKDGDHRMNEKGELPPKEWLDERGCIKDKYWDRYWKEYTLETGEFWNKLREYEKENDVFLKGN